MAINRTPHRIGDGEYEVIYKRFGSERYHMFVGVCENFCSTGKSAFWNKDVEQMLLIDYKDIINLYPV